MAMPELGERLEMGLTRDGQVLLAGSYPKQSIFYVPQVSLPEGKVEGSGRCLSSLLIQLHFFIGSPAGKGRSRSCGP